MQNFAKGNVAEALAIYAKHGDIYSSKNRSTTKEQLVTDVMQSYEQTPDQSCLVLAYTRKDVADLNAMIKAEMVKYGRVDDADTAINITMQDGDIEYQQEQGFAVGDRILFRKNDKVLGVMNGSFGTLEKIEDGLFSIALDNGKTVTFSPEHYDRFQLGYAATVHKSQGITVDQTYVLATPHFDHHTTYVAMSRHKHSVKLYTSKRDFKNRNRLFSSLGKDGEKLSTLDFTDPRQQKLKAYDQSIKGRFFDSLKQACKGLRIKKPTPKPLPKMHPISQNAPQAQLQSRTPLKQQDFVKLREEFVDQTSPQSLPVKPPKLEHDQHHYRPER